MAYSVDLKAKNGGTHSVSVDDKLVQWGHNTIAINKINAVRFDDFKKKFPIWAALVIIIGLICFAFQAILAIILIIAGAAWIYFWNKSKYSYRLKFDTSSNTDYHIWVAGSDREKAEELRGVIMNAIANS